MRLCCTVSTKSSLSATARKCWTISLRSSAAVALGSNSYVSGKRKPSIEVVIFFCLSVRLNQKSGTPSAAGSLAAVLKSSTGILVALDSSAYTCRAVLPSGIVTPLVTRAAGSSRQAASGSPGWQSDAPKSGTVISSIGR